MHVYLLLFWTVRLKNPYKTEKIVRHIKKSNTRLFHCFILRKSPINLFVEPMSPSVVLWFVSHFNKINPPKQHPAKVEIFLASEFIPRILSILREIWIHIISSQQLEKNTFYMDQY